MGVFLGIQKAFGQVNHDKSIKKLDYAGIRGSTLNLIKSDLRNRTQVVRLNGIISVHYAWSIKFK